MIYKKLIKICLFIALFLILLNFISVVFGQRNQENASWLEYYRLPNETIDILFLGNSHSLVTFVPALINKDLNVDSYSLASNGANFDIVYYRFLEALKTQTPKIVVIELFSIMSDFNGDEGQIKKLKWSHAAFDGMQFSQNKISAINTLFPINNNFENINNQFDLYFPIINNHSNWKDEDLPIYLKKVISFNDLEVHSTSFGYKWLNKIHPDYIINNSIISKENAETNDIYKLNSEKEILLNKIISICGEKNIKLVFVIAPFIEQNSITSKDLTKVANGLNDLIIENDIPLINYNLLTNDIEFKYNDLEDDGHINIVGAFKVTNNFSYFIKENYGNLFKNTTYDLFDKTKKELWIVNKYYEKLLINQNNYLSE